MSDSEHRWAFTRALIRAADASEGEAESGDVVVVVVVGEAE